MSSIILYAVGFIFIIAALVTHFFKPKQINNFYGYRTARSQKNQSNWDFAQKRANLIMGIAGLDLIIIGTIFYFINISEKLSAPISLGIIVLTAILMIAKIEYDLKKFEAHNK